MNDGFIFVSNPLLDVSIANLLSGSGLLQWFLPAGTMPSSLFAHAEVLAVFIVDDLACLMSIEMGGTSNEIRHIEGEEPVAIETTRIPLRQHKGLGDLAIGIDMTEIGASEEPVVTTGTEYYPA